MSLISIKNVVEPFTNKVHLVTIIVITMTFGIYRASGGTIEVSNRGQDTNSRQGNPFQQAEPAKKVPIDFGNSNTAQQAPAAVDMDNDNFLESMLGSNAQQAAQEAPAQPTVDNNQASSDNGQAGGLADIEKSLGLK